MNTTTKKFTAIYPSSTINSGKPIPGFDSRYVATTEGLVYDTTEKCFLALYPYRANGDNIYYNCWAIDENDKRKKVGVHRLVALAFHGKPPSNGHRLVVDHINAISTDNRPENLRWLTYSENLRTPLARAKRATKRHRRRTRTCTLWKALVHALGIDDLVALFVHQ